MRRALVAVILLALALRIAVVVAALRDLSIPVFPDDYMQMARDWQQKGFFSAPMYGPVYPYLCRLALDAFGPVAAFHAVLFFQAVIGTISCLLLYGVAMSVGLGPRAAVTCATLAAVEPLSLITTGSVLTEPLYVTLLLLALWILLYRPTPIASLVSGVTWGIASLVRGVGLFAALGLVLHWLVSKTWPSRSLSPVLFWLGLSAPLLFWSGYNAKHWGVFSPGCSITWNLAVLWAGIPKQRAEGLLPEATMDTWQREMGADSIESNPFVMARKAAALATQWMLRHPWLMVKELCRSTAVFWAGPFSGQWSKLLGPLYSPGVAVLLVLWRAGYGVLAILGAVRLARYRQSLARLTLPVFMILSHEIPVGCAGYGRFAAPAAPFVCLLACIPISKWLRPNRNDEHEEWSVF